MPKYLIERSVPGAKMLTPDEVRDIATKSNAVVAGLGELLQLGSHLRRRRQAFLRARGRKPRGGSPACRRGRFPVDSITEISTTFGPTTGVAA